MRRHKHPSKRQLLEVELLASEHQRRITVDEHAAFIEATRPTQRFDEIDHAAAGIKPVQRLPERLAVRVLAILDELRAEEETRKEAAR